MYSAESHRLATFSRCCWLVVTSYLPVSVRIPFQLDTTMTPQIRVAVRTSVVDIHAFVYAAWDQAAAERASGTIKRND